MYKETICQMERAVQLIRQSADESRLNGEIYKPVLRFRLQTKKASLPETKETMTDYEIYVEFITRTLGIKHPNLIVGSSTIEKAALEKFELMGLDFFLYCSGLKCGLLQLEPHVWGSFWLQSKNKNPSCPNRMLSREEILQVICRICYETYGKDQNTSIVDDTDTNMAVCEVTKLLNNLWEKSLEAYEEEAIIKQKTITKTNRKGRTIDSFAHLQCEAKDRETILEKKKNVNFGTLTSHSSKGWENLLQEDSKVQLIAHSQSKKRIQLDNNVKSPNSSRKNKTIALTNPCSNSSGISGAKLKSEQQQWSSADYSKILDMQLKQFTDSDRAPFIKQQLNTECVENESKNKKRTRKKPEGKMVAISNVYQEPVPNKKVKTEEREQLHNLDVINGKNILSFVKVEECKYKIGGINIQECEL